MWHGQITRKFFIHFLLHHFFIQKKGLFFRKKIHNVPCCSINGETPEGKRQFVQDSVAAAGSSLTNAGSFCASRPSSIRHSLDQESETSSGFDDDDTMNTTANLCASSSDNVCDTVFIPSATEDTIQVLH